MATVREPGDGSAHDVADESSTNELKEEQFAVAEAEADRKVLHLDGWQVAVRGEAIAATFHPELATARGCTGCFSR